MAHNLTILQLNDLHGYLEPHAEMVLGPEGRVCVERGGLARIAAVFAQVRQDHPGAVLALDNGDTFHGTFVAVQSQGLALVPLLNALQFDAMTVHWEFAYGPEGVRRIAADLDYPILAINCFDKATGALAFSPYRMVERNGLRIAVIGIACNIVDKTMPPHFSEGLRFTVGREELPGWIDHVRAAEAADLVVVLSHLGFPQDVKLAGAVCGIDVLVSGHTHNRMEHPVVVNGAIIFQSGCHGSFLGRLDITVDNRKVVAHRHELIAVDARFPEDPGMREKVDAVVAPHRAQLSEVVGHTEVALDRYHMLSCPMDDLLLDAISSAAGTEIAFSNGWRYGAPIPPGPITLNDLWNIIPTNPQVSTVDLTGAEIVEMVEANLERTFASDPFEQMGGYVKRCRGLRLYVKLENPPGSRIERLFVLEKAVEPERTYKVAFVTAQGVPPKFGQNREKLAITAIDALRKHLARARVTPGACTVSAV